MSKSTKSPAITSARYWVGVLYPENMRADWEEQIGDIVQLPYAYCKHTLDRDSKSEHRKDHVHMILAFSNTTTYQHAMNIFSLLSAEGKRAINKCEACISIRGSYDYLIHDTETSRKLGKELYDRSERITGNNFDIGAYEQLDAAAKQEIFVELSRAIKDNGIFNYMDFFDFVLDTYEDANYMEIMRTYSSHFQRLCDGNYQKWQQGRLKVCFLGVEEGKVTLENTLQGGENAPKTAPSQAQTHFQTHGEIGENMPYCCPKCGSVAVKKNGKTVAGVGRWRCKDCGKSFACGDEA